MSDELDKFKVSDSRLPDGQLMLEPNPQGRSATREDKMRFFDELLPPIRKISEMTGIHEDLLLTLAAHESGWWGAVAQPGTQNLSRDKNNPFGFVKGGRKVTYPSLETALNIFRDGMWPERLGRTDDIESFVEKLQTDGGPKKPRYNSEYPDPNTYKDQLRRMYKSVTAAKEDWKSREPAHE